MHQVLMKILIIGRVADYNAEYFYMKYFRKFGHDVEIIDMFTGVVHRLFESLIHSRTKLFRFTLYKHEINRILQSRVREIDPDAIIVFRGEMISRKTLEIISSNFHTYLFYPDVFKFLKSIADRLPLYDAVFTAARIQDPYMKLGARRIINIPWACDPDFHREVPGIGKIYVVSFIGTAYPERRRILRSIRNAEVFGDYWYGFGPRSHGPVRGENYVLTVNKTSINLNLQTKASIIGDAPTMRTYEIAGCGGFQVSDFMPSLTEFFPRMPTFKNVADLQEMLSYYSRNNSEKAEIASANREICYRKYTYEIMAGRILASVHMNE